ncbi:chromosome segregation ATPase [Streptomyces glaucescens]
MPTQVLRDARRRDSRTKRARVLQIVQDMTRNGDRVTFSAVARAANVSTWLTYADGVREHIEHAIRQQTERPQHSKAVPPSQAGLRTDLELAREEIRRLRSERERLQQAVRQKLGHQLDQLGAQDLATRVQELTQANTSLEARLQEATTAKGSLELRVVELEDELAAARTSLRRMMRDRN